MFCLIFSSTVLQFRFPDVFHFFKSCNMSCSTRLCFWYCLYYFLYFSSCNKKYRYVCKWSLEKWNVKPVYTWYTFFISCTEFLNAIDYWTKDNNISYVHNLIFKISLHNRILLYCYAMLSCHSLSKLSHFICISVLVYPLQNKLINKAVFQKPEKRYINIKLPIRQVISSWNNDLNFAVLNFWPGLIRGYKSH